MQIHYYVLLDMRVFTIKNDIYDFRVSAEYENYQVLTT